MWPIGEPFLLARGGDLAYFVRRSVETTRLELDVQSFYLEPILVGPSPCPARPAPPPPP